MGYAIVTDQDRCINCKACELHCAVWNRTSEGLGVHLHVGPCMHDGRPVLRTRFMPCLQCEDARCLLACPTGAIQRREDGIIRIDGKLCRGCRACLLNCPWGVPRHDAALGKVRKCDMCADRLDAGLEPACIAGCATHALHLERTPDAPREDPPRMHPAQAMVERVRRAGAHTVVLHCLERLRRTSPSLWERRKDDGDASFFDGPLEDLRRCPELEAQLPPIPEGVSLQGVLCARHVLKPRLLEPLAAMGVLRVLVLRCAAAECPETAKPHGEGLPPRPCIPVTELESVEELAAALAKLAAPSS
ncbi:MAG: (Fe-S)-binding protein [Desulfovibrio sp.]|jgi:Fe-S-cluster-containing dehydrogenase component|nr:(Fe-S)-binding protein [Desulfovibrio sp.]